MFLVLYQTFARHPLVKSDRKEKEELVNACRKDLCRYINPRLLVKARNFVDEDSYKEARKGKGKALSEKKKTFDLRKNFLRKVSKVDKVERSSVNIRIGGNNSP